MDLAKNLKQTGILTIVIAFVDILITVLMVTNPSAYPQGEKITEAFNAIGISSDVAPVFVIVIMVILAIGIILVGLKAIIVAHGGRESQAINVLSIVLQVIFLLITLWAASTIVFDQVGVLESNIFIPIVTVIALGSILNNQKKLRNSKER